MANKHGHFFPPHDGPIPLIRRPDGYFETATPLIYHDPKGKEWTAPLGTITDGASIPSLIAGAFGGTLNTEFFFAAIVHDAYCAIANQGGSSYQIETWQDTHRMFYHACRANGTSFKKANTMYIGVRLGGPRWSFQSQPFTNLSQVDSKVLEKEMDFCEKWAESRGDSLTLEEIDQWMDLREPLLLEGNI